MGDDGISKWQEYEISIAKARKIPLVGVSVTDSVVLANEQSSFFKSIEVPNIQWTFEKLKRVLSGEDQSISYEQPAPERLSSQII